MRGWGTLGSGCFVPLGQSKKDRAWCPLRLLPRGAGPRLPMRLSQLIIPTPMFLKLKNKLEIKY